MIPVLLGVGVFASVLLLFGRRKEVDPQERNIRERLINEVGDDTEQRRGPLVEALRPIVRWNAMLRLYRRRGFVEETVMAGKLALTSAEFFALKELAAIGTVALYVAITGITGIGPMLAISALFGWMLPDIWMRQQRAARHQQIARDLPELVDLLTLCVDAGADFMGALQRVVREYRVCPIREELGVVLQEIRIGKRRREAFRSMAQRVRMPDVSAFTRAIVQADRMGTGMALALRIMAEDTRLRRYHAAERFAQQAPLKMLLPLVLIMLVALIMVAGPIMLEFMKGQNIPTL